MKKGFRLLLVLAMLLSLMGCADTGETIPIGGSEPETTDNGADTLPPSDASGKVLIAYFSCTHTTEKVAEQIRDITGGTLYPILPQDPYTEEDLKYYTNGRAAREQADKNARPAIQGSVTGMEDYDIVFLGYPIWHGQAPRILSTFLESYDFSHKTIVPFCTSQSSGIGNSDTDLHVLAPQAKWKDGKRFPANATQESIADWINNLNLRPSASADRLDPEREQNGCASAVMPDSGHTMPIFDIAPCFMQGGDRTAVAAMHQREKHDWYKRK